ncbi:hypothetical protein [Pseudomonas luteola]|uniref:hypothetical protein n=1 Tax=Pseudomonas luteola TaxID=47886 RepID=UPI00289B9FF6|nr:hypothetical protein [Pseudomonas luteola]
MSSREEEDFEAWWLTEQMKTFPTWYDKERLPDWGAAYKPAARKAWKASRAALVVELPTQERYDDPLSAYEAIKDCREAIEATGVQVKP